MDETAAAGLLAKAGPCAGCGAQNVIPARYPPVTDDLFPGIPAPCRQYQVAVDLAVTAGRGDMDAAGFLESLTMLEARLGSAGVPLAMMAAAVRIEVIVDAPDPETALTAGIAVVTAAGAGRRLGVKGARILSEQLTGCSTTAREPAVLTAG